MKKNSRIILTVTIILAGSILGLEITDTFAYRPFSSTDADVTEKGELEIEFGFLNIIFHKSIDEITTPSLIFNYGLLQNWEIIGEFELQVYKKNGRNIEIKDPALFLKGVLRQGILQDKKGLSFATEFGILIPSTLKDERKVGVEGIGILSGKISDICFHLNFGGEMDRENFTPHGIWGIILEYPFEDKFKIAGEVEGSFTQNELPENSCLLGFILEMHEMEFDIAALTGLTKPGSEWEVKTGMSFAF